MIWKSRIQRWLSAITAAAVVLGLLWLPFDWVGRHRISHRSSRKTILRLLTPAWWTQFVEAEQSMVFRDGDDLDEDTPIPPGAPDDLRLSARAMPVRAMQNDINYLEAEENNHAYDLNLPGIVPKTYTLIFDDEVTFPPVPAPATQPAAPSSAPTASGNGAGQ
jgi:hypothetical protein